MKLTLVLMRSLLSEKLRPAIEALWIASPDVLTADQAQLLDMVLQALDRGHIQVVYKTELGWQVNIWIKQAILLILRYNSAYVHTHPVHGFDKIPSKFAGWDQEAFSVANIRVVPGATARKGAYIAPGVILMQSFVNIGAYVETGTMIDTWALVGSCAYVGRKCHISAGVIIGGVLEPLQANPVIIEDGCFIGAQSSLTEGIIVEEGTVIGAGLHLSASTPIMNRDTNSISYGRIPPYSVVVPGMIQKDKHFLSAAIIVKQVDEKTRSKTTINELLRLP